MKKRTILLFLSITIMFSRVSFSNHVTGGEITYIHVDSNRFEVTLKLFHDCSGISLGNIQDVCFSSASCASFFMHTVTKISAQELLQPACSIPGTSACQGGNAPGIEEVVYRDTINLNVTCVDWVMSYTSCCTAANTILNQPAIYIEARLNNVLNPLGSSPQFQNLALPRFCLNVPSAYDFYCTDIDGDALQYSFTSVLDAGGACPMTTSLAGYNIPYSPTNPLSSSATISLNSSGLMTFTPNVIQTAIISVKVTALGGGGISGTVMRQNVVTIINGITGIQANDEKNVSVSISPNVSDQYFYCNVNAPLDEKIKTEIMNAFGEVVLTNDSSEINDSFTIDLAGFVGGIYFVSFTIGHQQFVKKIVKI